ncbi:SLBB domain-containing protein [Pedobacter antarcticus]|uniref:SLBB domain-containing protein n=1 Tax=Pedobacter antarcticus TaxID=34086 RepID=UPI00088D2AA0|nr:SLBB domain-containing protein [Pedobacter antarcticus]SDM16862.1 protein involved in polysaccharide export, contains SLBB domain of the beta-grasp fold [Pedobacter antarcticus]
MRIKFFTILLLICIAFTQTGKSQELSLSNIQNVKISQLTDQQIIQAWTKLEETGIPEKEAYKLMAQKGLPPGEVEEFKNRVTLLGLNQKGVKPPVSANKETTNFTRDTAVTVIKPEKKSEPAAPKPVLNIYGMDFFNQSTVKFEPNTNAATPKGYVLGPGDEVIVLVTGMNETTIKTKVSPDGNLQIPYAGLVHVNGLTIEQATSQVRGKLAKIYPALNSGQTQVAINLGSTRSIKVTLIGEVKTPGSYTLSSVSTLFNALYNSGGPSVNGSLRRIELIRNNKVYRTVDFYTFLQKGLMDGNIRLEDQDVIRIPVYTKRVSITGEVKKPAIYELKAGEQLDALLEYAGGYTDIAYRGTAKIEQINAIEREVKDVPSNLFSGYTPRNGDIVEIGAITNRFANRVILEGSVYRPGIYELTAGFSLGALLQNAQGLKPEAYMERGYIKRTLPNLEKEFISFNPALVLNGGSDIPLMRDDSVMIQDRSDFVRNQQVTVNGNVRTPTVFTYRKGMKLADVIAMSGGFTESAAEHHIEISRIIENKQDSVANQLVETFTVNLDPASGTVPDIELMPMDYIYIPRLVNYRTLGNIAVTGEVLFPGEYAVQRRDETAQDFLKRAGGITPYGSLENAQTFRNGVRVNLDLSSTSNNELVKKSMILLPGDSIYVPRTISFVEVAGAVNNPQFISYNGRRFKYYLNAAAGKTENARLKGAYVKYPDGLNKPVTNFLFFRNYPAIKPGSKIVVPEKSKNGSIWRMGLGEIGGITSAVTALISLIAILSK